MTDLGARLPDSFPVVPRGRGALEVPAGSPITPATRPMPVAESILWGPSTGGVSRLALAPVFVTQEVLMRIHEGLAAAPPGRGVGLLVGRAEICAQSDAPYLVVTGVVPLPVLAAERDPTDVLGDGLGEVTRAGAGGDVVGWYRSHSAHDAALTADDVGAHVEAFGDAPRIVVVVGGGGVSGGLFRQSASPAWPLEFLPFYELVSPDAVRVRGRQASALGWRNYLAAEPVVRPRAALPAAPPPKVLQLGPEAQTGVGLAARLRGSTRAVAYTGAVFAAALGVFGVSRWIGSGRDEARAAAPSAAVALAALDRQADTLALALQAFDVRARLFGARQMTCADLARGLEELDRQWVAYSAARQGTPAALDSAREGRDRALYANVRTVESRFDRTSCPRP